MKKIPEIVLGIVLASAIWAIVFVLNSDTSAYHQICQPDQYTGKESCTPHHILYSRRLLHRILG